MRTSTTGPRSAEGNLPRMITINELATILGMSKRTVWRLLSAGEIPEPVRLGGSTRWPLAQVEAWIADGCPHPSAHR